MAPAGGPGPGGAGRRRRLRRALRRDEGPRRGEPHRPADGGRRLRAMGRRTERQGCEDLRSAPMRLRLPQGVLRAARPAGGGRRSGQRQGAVVPARHGVAERRRGQRAGSVRRAAPGHQQGRTPDRSPRPGHRQGQLGTRHHAVRGRDRPHRRRRPAHRPEGRGHRARRRDRQEAVAPRAPGQGGTEILVLRRRSRLRRHRRRNAQPCDRGGPRDRNRELAAERRLLPDPHPRTGRHPLVHLGGRLSGDRCRRALRRLGADGQACPPAPAAPGSAGRRARRHGLPAG